MDRVVKIWRTRKFEGQLNREDKPLFSSSLVHRSAVASIAWYIISFGRYNPVSHGVVRLAEDTLFTHCNYTPFASHRVVPATTEQSIENEDETPELEWSGSPGRIVILRWLGLNRFFPPEATKHQDVQGGCVAVSWHICPGGG